MIYKIFLLVSLLFISACSDFSQNHPKDRLRIDIGAEATTLDPQQVQDTPSARIAYDLFAGLVDFDQENKPIPGMAYDWQFSDDKKTITFYLRDELTFSDGTPITAHDFVYSWKRLLTRSTDSAYAFLLEHVVNARDIMKGQSSPNTLGVSALDDKTFIVTLTEPDNTFIQKCTLPQLMVVPQNIIQKYGEHWTDPRVIVTSGAYQLKERSLNHYILAEKNPYYYKAHKVKIPQIQYFAYDDANAALAAYEAGELDITATAGPLNRYEEVKKRYSDQLHVAQQEAIYYYDFNLLLPGLANNIKLRQALSMAIDREALHNTILNSVSTPLYSVVTPTIENGKYADLTYAWAKEPREQQISEAKALYQQAGFGDNNPVQLSISFNTNNEHQQLASAIASMWKDVLGVQTTFHSQDWKDFIYTRQVGDFVIARDGWNADYNAVSAYLMLYQCNSPLNQSRLCNANYDKLLAEGNAEPNQQTQIKTYKKALKVMLNEYSIIPLYQYNYQRLIKPYVKNYQMESNHLDHVQSKWMYF